MAAFSTSTSSPRSRPIGASPTAACKLALLLALTAALGAAEMPLRAPLGTVIEATEPLPGDAGAIVAEVVVPDGAPADLGLGVYVRGDDGRWFQRSAPGVVAPGRHRLRFPLDQGWLSEPHAETWSPYRRALCVRCGVFAWSASTSRAVLQVRIEAERGEPAQAPPAGTLRDLVLERFADGRAHARAGERWTLSLLPDPFPANPYDPRAFALDLEVTPPDGPARRIPGFFDQPMRLCDRGDREVALGDGEGVFRVRFRPDRPGSYRLRLVARWAGGEERAWPLPDLAVDGSPCDPVVHVDPKDGRFFSVGGSFCWPIGLNLASPRDYGATKDPRYGIKPTPDRGSFAYDAYFARLAAAGADAAEVWLSTWNLGLEWQPGWSGYHGVGRYNEANAARLDRTLDLAWSHGLRLVLNLNNHGQAQMKSGESEWQWNPMNTANGGWLSDPKLVFTDQRALRAQDDLRRYIVARYADHPGVLVWKLWSEVDLTQLGMATIRSWQDPKLLTDWHRRACDDWHRLDSYRHPVATHVATTYQNAHPALFSIKELDAIGLDAYFQPGVYTSAESLFGLMVDTMFDPGDGWRVSGVARWRKPVFITEYGGGWQEKSTTKLEIEHRTGAWLALVTGEAASPMLWWHEWVDQTGAWAPYGAIHRFIAGEDLRGDDAASTALATEPNGGRLWCRAWQRRGRILGYVQDGDWAATYGEAAQRTGDHLVLGASVRAGRLHIDWWDADRGEHLGATDIDHPGGRLVVPLPTFRGHLAFKAWRQD
jgi:hypothetical protein